MKDDFRPRLSLMPIPDGLAERILARISLETRRSARRMKTALGAGIFVSFAMLGFLGSLLAEQFASSGAFQYVSLIFSDTSLALASWKEIAFSIVSSIPAETIGFFLASLFVTLLLVGTLGKKSGARNKTLRPAFMRS